MRPSKIKPGTKLRVKMALGAGTGIKDAVFIRRINDGRNVINLVRIPSFAGLNDPEDDGTCQMSDYDLSRRAEFA